MNVMFWTVCYLDSSGCSRHPDSTYGRVWLFSGARVATNSEGRGGRPPTWSAWPSREGASFSHARKVGNHENDG